MNETKELAYWITEREAMRERHAAKEVYPFSRDPAMAIPRYCNVHRENDRVTKWLAKHWRPKHHAVWEIVLARMINYIPSLEDLLGMGKLGRTDGLETAAISKTLKFRRDAGEKVFTSAYTISTCGESMDKIDYVMRVVCNVMIHEQGLVEFGTLAGFHSWLMQVQGLGSFLAAQVAADLKNTAGHPLQSAPDWWVWAAPGPGSRRGLSWYFYGKPDISFTDRKFAEGMKVAQKEVTPLLPSHTPRIGAQDFQNCLCEFSKYMRFKNGDRRVRNKYTPG